MLKFTATYYNILPSPSSNQLWGAVLPMMNHNQQSSWHHSCQQQNIASVTPLKLKPVSELVSSDLEICTTETLLRTQEELLWYRQMYENIPSVYLSLDGAGTILSVNQFGADALGYAPKDLINTSVFNLFVDSEQQRLSCLLKGLLGASPQKEGSRGAGIALWSRGEELTSGILHREASNWEFPLDCPASKIKWVKLIARLLPSEEKNPQILMVWEDITARKQEEKALEDAVQKQLEEIESLNRLKEEFISTVSHELRTPLTNMKMAIEMLGIALSAEQNFLLEMAKSPQESSKVERYFQILNNECNREINLINNFLDLQRLDTGVKPLVLETIKVKEWLRRVVELFNTRNHNRCQQELQLNIDSNIPPLLSDPFSLERILVELLTNACKFSPPGEKIIVTAQSKSPNIVLKVTNTGIEIAETEIPRIFDKFYRIPSNDPWKQGGTGLGLALVQKLIKHLGGTIAVESGLNRTCFSIQLPLSPVGTQEGVRRQKSEVRSQKSESISGG
jgi:signal transduction histidine kinase